jgi:GBP family porin
VKLPKTTLTVAALMMITTSASAQSTVGIYGIVDTCMTVSNGITGAKYQLNSGCSLGSRLGFRGEENLGGGTRATFILESGFNVDSGTMGQGGRLFGRKSLIGLSGSLGAIQLGRDYAPTFYLVSPIDPFSLGMGTASSMISTAARPSGSGRNDNALVYTSPEINGFSFKTQYAFGESTTVNKRANDSKGIFAGYKSGPLQAGAAYNTLSNVTETGNDKIATLGASYDFGPIKPALLYQSGQWEGTRTLAAPSVANSIFSRNYKSYMLGVTVPFGPSGSNLLASYKHYDDKTAANFDASQITVGYKHALSLRTKLYAAYSKVSNKNGAAYSVVDATTTYGPSTLFAGIEHSF